MCINKISVVGAFRIAIGITILILLIVGGAGATKFINNNATGGDCTSIGIWDDVTKTCILTTNLTETIQIDNNGITLDGNGHTISGSNTGNGLIGTGVDLSGRSGITIKNLNVEKFTYGIALYSSSNNTLTSNNASSNQIGIHLAASSNNTLTNNNASSNDLGIVLHSSSNNILTSNKANSNLYSGIEFEFSSNNTLSGNNVSYNRIGIHLHWISNNNTIYNNYFTNTYNVSINDGNSIWSINKTLGTNNIGGSYIGGNFWANPNGTGFSQTCADVNKDGICDSIYTLDASNTDFLPLKKQLTGTMSGTVRKD